jgi:hypothetical protein
MIEYNLHKDMMNIFDNFKNLKQSIDKITYTLLVENKAHKLNK